ncbi:MAG: hypothetical protein WKF47_13735 [Geodermatophilaceae bacterium]
MTPGRTGLSLAERLAGSGVRGASTSGDAVPTPAASADPGTPPAEPHRPRTGSAPRHCWVSGLPGVPARCPGLLSQWTRDHGRWLGRVVYAVVDDGQVVLVEAWIPAEHLAAAGDRPSG